MIEVKPFSLENLKTYEAFYCLQKISNVDEIEIIHNTPSGFSDFPFINAFSMPNGRIIIAWKHALNMALYYNLVARSGEITEVIQITSIEKILDIYDKSILSNNGVFGFANSDIVLLPNVDWRCDQGKYGPRTFPPTPQIAVNPENIIVFQPILSVTGVGHIIYFEYRDSSELAEQNLNNAERPTTGRTFWECLKIIREWSIVHSEPFDNNELVSIKAFDFMNQLNFSNEELSFIDNQVPMQIAKYILGDDNARQRPEGLLEMDDNIKNIILKRLSSGSVSALEVLNPGMWNLEELIDAERESLDYHRSKFEQRKTEVDMRQDYIDLQEKLFNNKENILNKIENGEF